MQRAYEAVRLAPALAVFIALVATASAAGAAGAGAACAGIANISCDAGLWCEPQAAQCGGADISAACVRVPEICNQAFIPVCGCDGKTYGNDCVRRHAKVQKSHDGGCS